VSDQIVRSGSGVGVDGGVLVGRGVVAGEVSSARLGSDFVISVEEGEPFIPITEQEEIVIDTSRVRIVRLCFLIGDLAGIFDLLSDRREFFDW
jgi:hypothetical protein